MPAVLDRPHPILIQPASPTQRRELSSPIRADLLAATELAGSGIDGRQRMRALVRVRSDHDHLHRPFVWLWPTKRISGGQLSLGAVATLLSSHAEGPRAATGDITFCSQT